VKRNVWKPAEDELGLALVSDDIILENVTYVEGLERIHDCFCCDPVILLTKTWKSKSLRRIVFVPLSSSTDLSVETADTCHGELGEVKVGKGLEREPRHWIQNQPVLALCQLPTTRAAGSKSNSSVHGACC
jgi:hypothetical protein